METFVHEFKSPINCYKALAVRHGFNTYPVAVFEGRQCYVTEGYRTRINRRGYSYHNRVIVHFLDGEVRSVPAGEWAKKAKNPPLPDSST